MYINMAGKKEQTVENTIRNLATEISLFSLHPTRAAPLPYITPETLLFRRTFSFRLLLFLCNPRLVPFRTWLAASGSTYHMLTMMFTLIWTVNGSLYRSSLFLSFSNMFAYPSWVQTASKSTVLIISNLLLIRICNTKEKHRKECQQKTIYY